MKKILTLLLAVVMAATLLAVFPERSRLSRIQ